MTAATSLQMCHGRLVDLLDIKPADVDFMVIAEHLAKANRYAGATPGVAYSVAEHSLLVSWCAEHFDGDHLLAAYLLLHDAHEAYFGDDTTPRKRAIAVICASFGDGVGHEIERALAAPIERCDAAVHAAAGLAWPPDPCIADRIKHWDRVALVTEWRDLMGGAPVPAGYDDVAPLKSLVLQPLSLWPRAAVMFLRRCAALLPTCKGMWQ